MVFRLVAIFRTFLFDKFLVKLLLFGQISLTHKPHKFFYFFSQ